jgi:hypothetical protein
MPSGTECAGRRQTEGALGSMTGEEEKKKRGWEYLASFSGHCCFLGELPTLTSAICPSVKWGFSMTINRKASGPQLWKFSEIPMSCKGFSHYHYLLKKETFLLSPLHRQ